MIAERTRAALAARKQQEAVLGNPVNAPETAALGRRVQIAEADRFAGNVLPLIDAIRATGITSLAGIARALDARGIAIARGGCWHVSTVRNVLRRERRG
ncbi:hypothetical protein KHP62_21420 [Rhodobacteraceae bacterium NNCM2]|nr:hypothetical protein [Coraliihabitans acroporae]